MCVWLLFYRLVTIVWFKIKNGYIKERKYMYTLTDAIKRQFVETKKHGKRNMDDHLKNGICIQTINMNN